MLQLVGVHTFKDYKRSLYSVYKTPWLASVMMLSMLSHSQIQKKIKTSEQVVRILESRPSDRRVASSTPRLLDVDGPSFSGCQYVCLCGAWQTETWRCWKEMCPWLNCQDIDRLQVPVDTSIQPVTALLQTPQMQQMGMAHMSSVLSIGRVSSLLIK